MKATWIYRKSNGEIQIDCDRELAEKIMDVLFEEMTEMYKYGDPKGAAEIADGWYHLVRELSEEES